MLQVTIPKNNNSKTISDSKSNDIFKVFATEKKKRKNKLPEAVPPTIEALPPPSDPPKPAPQYRYQSGAKDQHLTSELLSLLMDGKLALTTPAHIFAASPSIHKDVAEQLHIHCVEIGACEEITASSPITTVYPPPPIVPTDTPFKPKCSLPLQEIDVSVNSGPTVPGVINPGSQVVVI